MRFSCYEENFNYYRIVMTFDGWTRYGEKLHRATIYNIKEYRADERWDISQFVPRLAMAQYSSLAG